MSASGANNIDAPWQFSAEHQYDADDRPTKDRAIQGSTRWSMNMYFAAVQQCLDANPQAMRQRRETAEHPFGKSTLPMGDARPGV